MKTKEQFYKEALERISFFSKMPAGESVEQRFKRLKNIADKALKQPINLLVNNNKNQ